LRRSVSALTVNLTVDIARIKTTPSIN